MDFPPRTSCTLINFSKLQKILWMKNRISTEQFNNKMFKNSWKNISWFSFLQQGTWRLVLVFFKDIFKETLLPLVKYNNRTVLLLRLWLCLKHKQKGKQTYFAFFLLHYICYQISLWWDSAPAVTVPQRRLKSLLTLLITNTNGEEGPEHFHITASYCSRGNK